MSNLSQFAISGIKSFQTGYLNNPALSTSTGEDLRYYDLTLSAVDTAKTVVFISGYMTDAGGVRYGADRVKWRLTSTTNVRLSIDDTGGIFVRYNIIEFR